MVNAQLLDEKIKISGYRNDYVYNKLGISRCAFYNKKTGISPFKAAEIYMLSDLLNITDEEKQAIFFA